MLARPHDALFRSAFEAPAHAAALLRELLPSSLRDLVAWHMLRRTLNADSIAAVFDD